MKKVLLTLVVSCLLLSGCVGLTQGGTGEGTQASTAGGTSAPKPSSPSDSIASDAAQTKLQYYEELVKSLQEELLAERTEWYMEKLELQAQIDALKGAGTKPPAATTPSADAPTAETDAPTAEVAAFTYRVENGGVTILSYTGAATKVTVPSKIEGKQVLAIGDRAFENKTGLQEVILPDGVTKLGWFVFGGCVSLERVVLPASVISIEYGAFENCTARLCIQCVSGSYAEAYARSYGIRVKN